MCTPNITTPLFKAFVVSTKKRYEKYSEMLKWNSEPESILELGIGNAVITKEVILPLIPKNIKEYIGCDKFELPLKLAAENVIHENFKTYQMDAASKNIPEEFKNKFHHIFVNHLFHHTIDIR